MTEQFTPLGPVDTGPGTAADYTRSTYEVLNATAEDAFAYNPLPLAIRFASRKILGDDTQVDAATARDQVKAEGLDLQIPDDGIRAGELRQLMDTKRDEMSRNQVLSQSAGGVGLGSAQFAVGLVASMADPVNIASGFIPVGKAFQSWGWLKNAAGGSGAIRSATFGQRAAFGALEGAVGAAITELPVYPLAAYSEQADYTLTDSFINTVFGTALGTGSHIVAGFFTNPTSRTLDQIPVEDRPTVMKGALGHAANDTYPDASLVVEALQLQNRVTNTVGARSVYQATGVLKVTDRAKAEAVRVRLDEARTALDNARRSGSEAQARSFDEPAFARFDELTAEMNAKRAEIDALTIERGATADIKSLDTRIADLAKKRAKASAGDVKRLDHEIAALLKERDALLQDVRLNDTPQQTALRKELLALESEQRDLIPRISKARSQQTEFNAVTPSDSHIEQVKALEGQVSALERDLKVAESEDIGTGTYRPGPDGLDLRDDAAISSHANILVDKAREDAKRRARPEAKIGYDSEALAEMEAVLNDTRYHTDLTDAQVAAEEAALDGIARGFLGADHDTVMARMTDPDPGNTAEEGVKGFNEFVGCMLGAKA